MVWLSTNGERALNHTIVKRLILTTNTQATKVEFLNYVYTVKGIQCHSNRFELKKKQQNQVTLFKLFLCDILNSSCNAQYIHTTEHTYARLTYVVSLVDNEFSSKYCCVGLITVTNSVLTYHHH